MHFDIAKMLTRIIAIRKAQDTGNTGTCSRQVLAQMIWEVMSIASTIKSIW